MKFKTTKKEVRSGYRDVVSVPYCALETLLSTRSPVAYTTQAEGWAADVYDVDGVAIVTGYSPFGGIRPGYDVNQKYERRARAINGNGKPYDERKHEIDNLLKEYIEEVAKYF